MEVNDSYRYLRGGNGGLYSVEHPGRDDEYRNTLRIRDRLRGRDGDAQDQSECGSSIPRSAGSAGSNSRDLDLLVVDVLFAGRKLVPVDHLASGRIGNLFPLWKTTQRDGAAETSVA